ncbi:MAG: class I SAM-dependent methyltransferase [Pseudomonadales bacterium]|nr:class I SAM-dependent methyltransferase [Pseudomonadales bacterium]
MWKILCNDFFYKYFDKKDIVLDLPCGYGEFINNINVKYKIAIDINPDSKRFLNKGVKFYKALSNSLPLNNKSVDKIFVSNFFEHITRKEIQKTIIEFKRILKDNGKIIILQPNIRFCSKDYWMFFDHITPIDDRALDEIFEINGFNSVEKIVRFLPYTTKSTLPKKDWMIRLYLKIPILWKFFGAQSLLVYKKLN